MLIIPSAAEAEATTTSTREERNPNCTCHTIQQTPQPVHSNSSSSWTKSEQVQEENLRHQCYSRTEEHMRYTADMDKVSEYTDQLIS